jgi:TetR/AcrR family transcriptional regulator, transcriptional repressor for nem operon
MQNTKDYIVNEAFKLFLNHSYEAVTINEISKSIGLTKGALYHHYSSKEEIFREVINRFLVVDTWDIQEKCDTLKEYIEASLNHTRNVLYKTFGEQAAFVPVNYLSMLIDALRHYPGFENEYELKVKKMMSRVTEVMRAAASRGEIRDDLDVEITALNYFSINLGIAANLYTYKSTDIAVDYLQKQLHEFYKLIAK